MVRDPRRGEPHEIAGCDLKTPAVDLGAAAAENKAGPMRLLIGVSGREDVSTLEVEGRP